MKKTMMYLPDEMHRYLARTAEGRRSSMAQITREAIAEYRERHADTGTTAIGVLFGVLADDNASTDLAVSVDETLEGYYAQDGAWEGEHLDASAD
ncbi:MAG: hypothetical protein WCI74_17880 [Actinomycetes bacterium]